MDGNLNFQNYVRKLTSFLESKKEALKCQKRMAIIDSGLTVTKGKTQKA